MMSVLPPGGKDLTLYERLIERQPESRKLLERLIASSASRRDAAAFAEVDRGRCSACHVAIAAMKLRRLKLGEFVNCGNCYRFLYVAPEERTGRSL